MSVAGDTPDYSDRLDFTVDPDAEPVDLDEALASFLVSYHRSRSDASEGDDHNNHEAMKGRTMTLQHCRDATAHLSGDLELLCAGASIGIVWHDDDHISIDDEAGIASNLEDSDSILYGEV